MHHRDRRSRKCHGAGERLQHPQHLQLRDVRETLVVAGNEHERQDDRDPEGQDYRPFHESCGLLQYASLILHIAFRTMRVYMLSPGLRQQIIDDIRTESRPLSPIPTVHPADLRLLQDVSCVAFDVYGTLLVSGAGEVAAGSGETASGRDGAFRRVASLLGLPDADAPGIADAYHDAVVDRHTAARATGTVQPEIDVLEVWSAVARTLRGNQACSPEVLAVAYELTANPVWPMPGAIEAIETLRRRGVVLAVVSNAQFYTPLTIEALFGSPPARLGFHPCIWSWEIGVAKPDPGVFRRLSDHLETLGIAPRQTIYVGNDMLNDVTTAQEAGYRGVLFAGDRRSLRLRAGDHRVHGHVPDAVVTDLRQIPDLVA